MASEYPEPWVRQTPKGYEPSCSIARLEDGVSIIPDNGFTTKCHYCDKDSLYTQPQDTKLIDVCKKHFSMNASS
jgi:hypothetical protein